MAKIASWWICILAPCCLALSGAMPRGLCASETPPATEADQADDQPTEESLPRLSARLLFVKRNWSQASAQPLRQEIIKSLGDKQRSQIPATHDDRLLSIRSFLPGVGQAAVFKPDEFESLCQWLRERELLVKEMAIHVEKTRFEGRWTAKIEPAVNKDVAENSLWHLQIDLRSSRDPSLAAYVSLRRAHSRRSPPGGPQLRGAAVDIRKEITFPLPRDRVVLMSWYSHPEDLGGRPNQDERDVEPILVIHEEREPQTPHASTAAFHLPERAIKLIVP